MEALGGRSSLIWRLSKVLQAGGLREQRRCYISRLTPCGVPVSITSVAVSDLTDGYASMPIGEFKEKFFDAEKPLLMRSTGLPQIVRPTMPAISKWFDSNHMSSYLKSFSFRTMLPFELAYPQVSLLGNTVQNFIESLTTGDTPTPGTNASKPEVDTSEIEKAANLPGPIEMTVETKAVLARLVIEHLTGADELTQKVIRLHAPLALLTAATEYNVSRPNSALRSLYVAQAPINNLPKELQDDLPVPAIVNTAGKGDIYDSSIWLGLQPTFTPLHRDPNPNLFVQLCSSKIVRLLPPKHGNTLFTNVRKQLPVYARDPISPRLRGSEMMDGPELDALRKAVWHGHCLRDIPVDPSHPDAREDLSKSVMQEAHLNPGDALFIPKGWWHSVKSEGEDGAVNASVNWWFR